MQATLIELLTQRIADACDEHVRAVQDMVTAKATAKASETKVIRNQRSIEAFQAALDFENARLKGM